MVQKTIKQSIHRRPELEYGKHDRKTALLIDVKRTLPRLKIIDQAHLTPQALNKKKSTKIKIDSSVNKKKRNKNNWHYQQRLALP